MFTLPVYETIHINQFCFRARAHWETEILDWDLTEPFTGEIVEFDLSEGTLKAPGDTPGNIWYLATHESTVEFWKWSFDVKILDTPRDHFYVFLMTDDWPDYPYQAYGYDLIFSTEGMGEIALIKRDGYQEFWNDIGSWYSTKDILGWHHVEVTRDVDGVFDVYFDDEHIMNVEDTSSFGGMELGSGIFTSFRFEAPSGPEIDNIVIEGLPVEEPEPEPSPSPEPEPEEESTGGGIPGFPLWSLLSGLTVISYMFVIRKK